MAWVRLDENFAQHPKVVKAGPLGMAMHVAALCYCNQHLTDGFVPKQIARTLLDLTGLGMGLWDGGLVGGGHDAEWEMIVNDLVEAGLWDPEDDGWVIHDYHDYQPSKAHILSIRKSRADAGRRGGQAKGKQAPSKTEPKAEAKLKPVPDTDKEEEEKREGALTQTAVVAKSADPTPDLPSIPESLKRGTRLSLDSLLDDWRQFCQAERPDLDPERIWAIFQDHWRGKARQAGVKLDWLATWRNWIRREGKGNGINRRPDGGGGKATKDERGKAALVRGLAAKLPEPPR